MRLKRGIFIAVVICASALYSQNLCGVYLTGEDFSKKKLSHSSPNTKIKTHETFKKDIVEVKCNDSLITFKKKDVYGYCNKDGECFRFFNQKVFPVINPYETILFYKITAGTGAKNSPEVETYYFSKNASSPITLLTLRNVESEFSNNAKFLKLLEVHFGDTSDLLEYDKVHKMYKLNRLLEMAGENGSQ